MLKTCFTCGNKVEKVYSGKCEVCLKEQNPPIKEIKPIKGNICNMSSKIEFHNTYYEQDEFEEKLPFLIKKNIIIDENYSLKDLEIENFEVDGHILKFDVVVNCDVK